MPKISYGGYLFVVVSTLILAGDSNIIRAGDLIERKILLWRTCLLNFGWKIYLIIEIFVNENLTQGEFLYFFPYFYLPIFLFSMAWTSGKLIGDEALCHWRYVYTAIKIVNINPFFRHLSFFPLGVFRVHFPHAVWITSYDYSHFSSLKMLQEK